ncbi:hypothetical protein J27TS8_43670 [Robertmurraya siralis]|uniref:DUF378 domain-containing protein n=1 Tax=Robertmurraya siralis TaxID=77777 RepID=A0A919WMC8_9BACI|nr:DUF378 domain-containing protein [Robertmurraya siralis]PAE20125.1 DUF378 domain-containing protein [Bacillus sp. 7504-2]GIN64374.1 hypothetical protein J27TS8_43670 [Robertmurraya siralis]
MKIIQRIALTLIIIGAINWGLIGFFQFDLVAAIFGGQEAFLSRLIYGLVGLSGLICLSLLFSPMNEEVERNDDRRQTNRNPNYATEFGEDADLSKLKDDE